MWVLASQCWLSAEKRKFRGGRLLTGTALTNMDIHNTYTDIDNNIQIHYLHFK